MKAYRTPSRQRRNPELNVHQIKSENRPLKVRRQTSTDQCERCSTGILPNNAYLALEPHRFVHATMDQNPFCHRSAEDHLDGDDI